MQPASVSVSCRALSDHECTNRSSVFTAPERVKLFSHALNSIWAFGGGGWRMETRGLKKSHKCEFLFHQLLHVCVYKRAFAYVRMYIRTYIGPEMKLLFHQRAQVRYIIIILYISENVRFFPRSRVTKVCYFTWIQFRSLFGIALILLDFEDVYFW